MNPPSYQRPAPLYRGENPVTVAPTTRPSTPLPPQDIPGDEPCKCPSYLTDDWICLSIAGLRTVRRIDTFETAYFSNTIGASQSNVWKLEWDYKSKTFTHTYATQTQRDSMFFRIRGALELRDTPRKARWKDSAYSTAIRGQLPPATRGVTPGCPSDY